jgi:hypothetical protein
VLITGSPDAYYFGRMDDGHSMIGWCLSARSVPLYWFVPAYTSPVYALYVPFRSNWR